MRRGPRPPRPARARTWLLAGLALALDLGTAALLVRAGLPLAAGAARWVPAVGALLAYAVVVLVGLPRASSAGRVGAAAALWAAHVLLSLLNGAIYSLAQDRLTVTVIQVVWTSPVLQALQVLWVVLALVSFRRLIVKPRRRRRRRVGATPSQRRSRPTAASPGLETPPPDPASTEGAPSSLPEAFSTPPLEAGAAIEESPPLVAPVSPIDLPPPAESDPFEPQPASTLTGPEALMAEPAPAVEQTAMDGPSVRAATPLPEHEGPRAADMAPLAVALDPPIVVARERADELRKLATAFTPFSALLAPGGALGVDVHAVGGITMLTVFAPSAAKEDLLGSILPFLPCLRIASGRSPVDQLTLRGPRGVLVATALGPPVPAGGEGAILVAGTRHRGALALLELVSRRAAREYRPVGSWEASAGSDLPDLILRLAGDLEAIGSLIAPAALSAEEELLYVSLDRELEPSAVGRLARALHRAARSAGSDGMGTIQSMTLRIGSKQVIVRPVPGRLGSWTLLVVAGPTMRRAGLAQREVEITSARLTAHRAHVA